MSEFINDVVKLLTQVLESGAIHVIYAPNVDSIIASSIISRVLLAQGIEVDLIPQFCEAPDDGLPVVMLGLEPSTKFSQKVISVKYSEEQRIVTGSNITYVLSGSSAISTLITKVLEEIYVVPTDIKLLSLIASLDKSMNSVFSCEFSDLEKSLISDLVSEGVISIMNTIKIFKYPSIGLAEALYYTIDPFIPGLSGDLKSSSEFVKSLGISDRLSDPDRDKLVSQLLQRMTRTYRRTTFTKDVLLGDKVVVEKHDLIDDIYETYYALSYVIDRYGYYVPLTVAHSKLSLASIIANYREKFREIVDYINVIIEGLAEIEKRSVHGESLSIFRYEEVEEPPPPALLQRVLRSVGLIGDEKIVIQWSRGYSSSVQRLIPTYPLQIKDLDIEGGLVISSNYINVVKVLR